APADCPLLSAVAEKGFPVGICFCWMVGRDWEREGLVVFEGGTAIETDAGNARHDEIDGQYVPSFATGIVGRGSVHTLHAALRESCGVEAGRSLGILVIP